MTTIVVTVSLVAFVRMRMPWPVVALLVAMTAMALKSVGGSR